MDCTTVTLWGDFALNDGAFLEKLKDDQPILGLCDVRVSIYKGIDNLSYLLIVQISSIFANFSIKYVDSNVGIFGISTLPVSSVLINPIFQKALDLRAWYKTSLTNMLDNFYLTLLPQLMFKQEFNNIATICL